MNIDKVTKQLQRAQRKLEKTSVAIKSTNISEKTLALSNSLSDSFSQSVSSSNEDVARLGPQAAINMNGSYLFQDEESMDILLNKLGLAIQRKGGI